MKKHIVMIMIIQILCIIILAQTSTVSATAELIGTKKPTSLSVEKLSALYNEPIGPTQQEQPKALGLGILNNPDEFIEKQGSDEEIIEIGNVIVGVVKFIGEAIAVTIIIVIGIRYVLASVEEKAEYKQSMIPYLVGAALIFGGAVITDLKYTTIRG